MPELGGSQLLRSKMLVMAVSAPARSRTDEARTFREAPTCT